mmetsp:Transcript_45314/g.89061  ORF Transcript_45314/g.89061 Transcript_45314/m.89061 type:complete len:263 (+) Transcript_45314:2075-2863(+)
MRLKKTISEDTESPISKFGVKLFQSALEGPRKHVKFITRILLGLLLPAFQWNPFAKTGAAQLNNTLNSPAVEISKQISCAQQALDHICNALVADKSAQSSSCRNWVVFLVGFSILHFFLFLVCFSVASLLVFRSFTGVFICLHQYLLVRLLVHLFSCRHRSLVVDFSKIRLFAFISCLLLLLFLHLSICAHCCRSVGVRGDISPFYYGDQGIQKAFRSEDWVNNPIILVDQRKVQQKACQTVGRVGVGLLPSFHCMSMFLLL